MFLQKKHPLLIIILLLNFAALKADQNIQFDKKLGNWKFGHETESSKGTLIPLSTREGFTGRTNFVRLTDTSTTEPTYGINLRMENSVPVSRERDYILSFDIRSNATTQPLPTLKIIQYDNDGKGVTRDHAIYKHLTYPLTPGFNQWETVQFPINGKSLSPATTHLKFVLFGIYEEKCIEKDGILSLETPNGTAVTYYDNIALTEVSSIPEGSLISAGNEYSIWQSPAEQKVISRSLPSDPAGGAHISAARGETESFQLVITPGKESAARLRNVEITALKNHSGKRLPDNAVSIREVVYLPKNRVVTDISSISSESFPDPLPLLNIPTKGLTLSDSARETAPLWISVAVPDDAEAGEYRGTIELCFTTGKESIPFTITVWDFTLPRTPRFKTKFAIYDDLVNEFFHTPLPKPGKPDLFYEKRREVQRNYLDLLAAYRMTPLSPFHTDSFSLSYEEKIQGRWQRVWKQMPHSIDPLQKKNRVFEIIDNKTSGDPVGKVIAPIPIDGSKEISLHCRALLRSSDREFMVFTYLYDRDMNPIVKPGGYGINLSVSKTGKWERTDSKSLKAFTFVPNEHAIDNREVHYISFIWYPTPWDGSKTAELFIDDITLTQRDGKRADTLYFENFERRKKPEYRAIFDTTDGFWETARYAFDTLGIPIFRLELPDFAWLQGSDMKHHYRDIPFVEWNNREMSVLVKAQLTTLKRELGRYWERAYIEWLDEPYSKMQQIVNEGMAIIDDAGTGIPKSLVIARDKEVFNNSNANIWTPLSSLHEKKWADERLKDENSEMWWYVCTGPQTPFANFFIDKEGIEHRILFWQAFANDISGLSYWCANWYRTGSYQEDGSLLQSNRSSDNNPWGNPTSRIDNALMSNGDGRLIYPPRDSLSSEPVPSIRMELIRDGIEDIDMLTMLKNEKEKLPASHPLVKRADECLAISKSLIGYDRSPKALHDKRRMAAETLEMILKEISSQK